MQDENQGGPGTVIQPGGAANDATPQPEQQPTPPVIPEQPITPPSEPSQEPPVATQEVEAKAFKPEPATTWQYHGDSTPSSAEKTSTTLIDPVQWTASEFIEHSKGISWYAMLVAGAIVLAAILYILTKDKISVGVIVLGAIVFGVLANHKPRELNYKVDESGVHIGEKSYPYENLKSFALVQENAVESIWLMPLKRFMPIISIYFDPKDEQQITDVLAAYLPLEDHKLDLVDRLMHKIRF